ncbi:HTH domain-containing protein [Paenibacillus pinisoli]|uniref:HTH domain-containing protein n=1 Tax=Paenibacillus pinisoli TaxID=1276110 RepID=A0A3A6Q1F2_9BACL|nr:HTH domain-containing protein [Paenibacillus pinisoli]RJX41323.1 HTH domain-containing protein [Paenibacillus pinisoli]
MSEKQTELKISAGIQKFIDKMGLYYESYGIPRIGGRILGLLLTASEPISAETISKTLQVSRSSVSTNIRLLTTIGLLDITQKPLDRTDYFILSDEAWVNAIRLRIQGFQELSKMVEQGRQAMKSAGQMGNTKLQEMEKWAEMMQNLHQQALDEWKPSE